MKTRPLCQNDKLPPKAEFKIILVASSILPPTERLPGVNAESRRTSLGEAVVIVCLQATRRLQQCDS
jgi:hypothetical protein